MKRKLLVLFLILSLVAVPVVFAGDLSFVTDEADLLTQEQILTLENMAQAASEQYSVDIYIITLDDYRDYGTGDVFEVSYQIYHQYNLGYGAQRNGILLLLSMQERDYSLFVYGPEAETAFSDYALEKLEERFLDDLAFDEWYDGLYDYAETCAEFLDSAANGSPVRKNMLQYVPVVILVSLVIAFIVCSILKGKMKSVFKQVDADTYTTGNGLTLTGCRDLYTHTTTRRTKVSSSSGGSSRSGGGGSGRSGKF